MKAYCAWPPILYLAGLQDQPPVASKWPKIIFDIRIEILALINQHLDIQEGIIVWTLYLYLAGLQDQPPVAFKCLSFISIFRIKYLNKKIYFKCIILFWFKKRCARLTVAPPPLVTLILIKNMMLICWLKSKSFFLKCQS